MSTMEAIVEKLQALPELELKRVLAFVSEIKIMPSGGWINPAGMFEHLGLHLSAEDIDEARREMWTPSSREEPRVKGV